MKDSSLFMVRGLVLNPGTTSPDEAIQAFRHLKSEVPRLANLGADKSIKRLGNDSADFLVEFQREPTIQQVWSAVHGLQQCESVVDAEPAVVLRSRSNKEITRSSGHKENHIKESSNYDWAINQTNVSQAWKAFGVSGKGLRIAHPDTGYTTHPEIMGPRLRVAEGYDYEDDDKDPADPLDGNYPGHGTATASVIFSGTTASPHVFGVAPGAEIVPYRVSRSVIHTDFTNLIQALYAARDGGCHVVSMSLGGPWAGRSLQRAVDALADAGLILLAAAGNYWKYVVYPAKLENVIAVAASNARSETWRGSARGEAVDVTAPGESVWRAHATLDKNGHLVSDIARSSGTSYAVATAAGVCALWLQHHGVMQLRERYRNNLGAAFLTLLLNNCRTVDNWDTSKFGPGILDATLLLSAKLPILEMQNVNRSAEHKQTENSLSEKVRHYLPELKMTQIERVTSNLLGWNTTRRHKEINSYIASLQDEVEFHIATSPGARKEFVASAIRESSYRSGNPANTLNTLVQLSSPELKEHLYKK